jgi:hypothetical protein
MLPQDEPSILRFLGDQKEPALLAPVTAFTTIDPSVAQAKITGRPAHDPAAGALLLASPAAVSAIDGLIVFLKTQNLADRSPSWIGLPQGKQPPLKESPHASLGSPEGDLVVRDKKKKVASFALYPVQSSQAVSRLQPAGIKLAEPKGNLAARSQWFQRRTGRKNS